MKWIRFIKIYRNIRKQKLITVNVDGKILFCKHWIILKILKIWHHTHENENHRIYFQFYHACVLPKHYQSLTSWLQRHYITFQNVWGMFLYAVSILFPNCCRFLGGAYSCGLAVEAGRRRVRSLLGLEILQATVSD